jgi:hypothetical protein
MVARDPFNTKKDRRTRNERKIPLPNKKKSQQDLAIKDLSL